MIRNDLRNIAIIAHVDHGKTTLVDQMLKQSGAFRENQVVQERVMDSNDQERERGITILAKNTAVNYNGVKINVVDTPGHADFSGEVERILKMVGGVILLVDSFEGPMPQTRFVLQKALEMGHKVITVINKMDKPDARCDEVAEEVMELLFDLEASDEQIDSKMLCCSGRDGIATFDPAVPGVDLKILFDTILTEIQPPQGDSEAPLQMLISSLDYNDYVGRIAVGCIERGTAKVGDNVCVVDANDPDVKIKGKIVNLYQYEGLNRVPATTATVGDIVCISGIDNITIGQTICDVNAPEALPFVNISEPTIEMTFSVNDSPFAGKEGKFLTSRHLRERLMKETIKDVSLRVTDTDTTESFRVAGRGEMHLSVLIENMRREGYELQVSTPQVLYKHDEDGKLLEPIETLVVDVPDFAVGAVMEKIGSRKGELVTMNPMTGRTKMEFKVPSRGLFGYRNEFLTDTKGEGIMSSVFDSYAPFKGEISKRNTGSLIAFETGEAVTYGLYNAQERGILFIPAGTPVYEGMVIGQSPRAEDMAVNVCKKKQLTNTRASGSDDALRLTPHKVMGLEQAIEFIKDDELIEVTPANIRIRKKILNNQLRMKKKAVK
ncbi:MAG: translational GTPase TypA [Oscillospiraceae bacterium]|nr:translational GTPase TypA [Oscillospiraceae bacterium]